MLNNTFWFNVSVSINAPVKRCRDFTPALIFLINTTHTLTIKMCRRSWWQRACTQTHTHAQLCRRAHNVSARVYTTIWVMMLCAEPVRRIPWRSESPAAQRNIKLHFKSNGSHQSVNQEHYTPTRMTAWSLIQSWWCSVTSADCLQLQGSLRDLKSVWSFSGCFNLYFLSVEQWLCSPWPETYSKLSYVNAIHRNI